MSDRDTHEASSLWSWVTEARDGSGVSQIGITVMEEDEDGTKRTDTIVLTFRSRAIAETFRTLAREHGEELQQRVWLRQYRDYVDHEDA
jgi:hypothetical protein